MSFYISCPTDGQFARMDNGGFRGDPCGARKGINVPAKRVKFDDATWQALDLLARDRMMDFQELADEAFVDLLRKHGRPTDLKSALRQSLAVRPTNQEQKASKKQKRPGQ